LFWRCSKAAPLSGLKVRVRVRLEGYGLGFRVRVRVRVKTNSASGLVLSGRKRRTCFLPLLLFFV
jgi:hypothetical protein